MPNESWNFDDNDDRITHHNEWLFNYWFSVAFHHLRWDWWWLSVDVVDEIRRIMNRVQRTSRPRANSIFSLFSNQTRLQRVLNFFSIAPLPFAFQVWWNFELVIENHPIRFQGFKFLLHHSSITVRHSRRISSKALLHNLEKPFLLSENSNNAVIWSVVRQPAVHVK